MAERSNVNEWETEADAESEALPLTSLDDDSVALALADTVELIDGVAVSEFDAELDSSSLIDALSERDALNDKLNDTLSEAV